MTIDEIKERKIKLESDILKLVQDYEEETGSFVSYIDFERMITRDSKSQYIEKAIPEPERDGPIENVNVSMRFDL